MIEPRCIHPLLVHHVSRWDVDPVTGCWIWSGGCMGHGRTKYPCVRIHSRGGTEYLHRILAGLRPGDGLVARHKCDNHLCVNPDHLESGTHADNARDRVVRGRAARTSPRKIKPGHVRQIRELRSSGAKLGEIADRFGIARTHVCAILKGRRHANVS